MRDVRRELIDLYAAVDRTFAEVSGGFPSQVKCGRGCADCCRAVFDMSLVEAVALAGVFQEFAQKSGAAEPVRARARKALAGWERIEAGKSEDIPRERIDCPLLDEEGLCRCYEARPINCRTYGIPTVIDGAGHVCGFSGFERGRDYPVVDLARIQSTLLDLSRYLAGEQEGRRRWPVAKVILAPQEIFKLLVK